MADLDQFRAETRAWLEANCPAEMRTPMRSEDDACWGGRNFEFQSEAQKQWMDAMGARGYVFDAKSPDLRVNFQGIVPDLFREGQGVVVEGRLGRDKIFTADTVLAKHDENYMPPEVADTLKKQHQKPTANGPLPTT